MALESVPPPGSLLAEKYRVLRVLGQGGMGVVLEATHEMLATSVAIKVMSAQALETDNAIPRFLREARAAAALRSEYVARVTDFGTLPDGRPFMVMELLDGEDLSAIIKGGGLTRTEWIDALLQACAGLAEAHGAGIVHRDLKLANFFRTRRPDGSYCTKILDFGISKLAKTDGLTDTATKSSVLLGTPYYMSPEHVRSNRAVDSRSDIWQMGVVLYQAMTGCLPFDGDNVGMLFARILEIEPRPPSGFAPDLPDPIERVILACLDKNPGRRPATISQVAAWLEPFAGPEGQLAAQRARAMQATPFLPLPSSPGVSGALGVAGAASLPPVTGPEPTGPAAPPSASARSEWTEAPVSRSIGKPSPSLSFVAIVIGGVVTSAAALGFYAYARSTPTTGSSAVTETAAPSTVPTPVQAGPAPTDPGAAGTSSSAAPATPSSSASAPPAVSASATVQPARPRATHPAAPRPPTPPKPPERPTLH